MAIARPCAVCGRLFSRRRGGKDAFKCCSRACGWRYLSMVAQAKRLSVVTDRTRACRCCGGTFQSARGRLLCSSACQLEWKRSYARSAYTPRRHSRDCKACGAHFTPEHGASLFCSERCARRAVRAIRKPRNRALKFGVAYEPISPVRVCERDGWRCQLCGIATPRRLRGTNEPNAPEIDHIVPVSLGGGHVWSNVQCACRACNGRKGATVQGQMRLAV